MISLFKTNSVVVHIAKVVDYNDFDEPVVEYTPKIAEGVLYAQVNTTDADKVLAPYLGKDICQVHFPKGYAEDLTGALIELYGKKFKVIGSPCPLMEENTPGEFNLCVYCECVS